MRIIRYRVVEASNIEKLTNKVQELIEMGWQPLGGVSPGGASDGYTYDFIQAMVLYAES
jgi:hypothetical protein